MFPTLAPMVLFSSPISQGTFQITAGQAIGALQIQFSLSGSMPCNFLLVSDTLNVIVQSRCSIGMPGLPNAVISPRMQANTFQTFSFNLVRLFFKKNLVFNI